MENQAFKDIIKTKADAKLSDNEDYYNNVFKKTERVVSALLYVLSYIDNNQRQIGAYSRLEDCLYKVHDAVLASLTIKEGSATEALYLLQHTLLTLESNLRLAVAARVLSEAVAVSVAEELDGAMRYIRNHYIADSTGGRALGTSTGSVSTHTKTSRPATNRPRRVRANIPQNDLSSDAVMVYSDLNDRSVRIKTVLEATPNATIKDLSEVITDVSSKTIQRELNSLIEKGEVIRQGERRWSTYNVVK